MPNITLASFGPASLQSTQTASRTDVTPTAQTLAYSGGQTNSATPVNAGSLYRLERGTPYKRKGKTVYATPQFKALSVYTPTTSTAQIPGTNLQGVSVSYPTKTK